MSKQSVQAVWANRPVEGPLTEEQWQGLARLADISNLFSSLMGTPVGGMLTEETGRLADVYTRNSIPELLQDVVETVRSLRESGLLDMLKDNADLIAQTVNLSRLMLDETWSRLDAVEIDAIREDLEFGRSALRKTRLLAEFVEVNLSAEAVSGLAGLLEFATQEHAAEALAESIQTLSHLYANGSLSLLREASDTLTDVLGSMDKDAVARDWLQRLEKMPLTKASDLIDAVENAFEDARQEEGSLGGVRGLLSLLTDRQVQVGLKTLAAVTVRLEEERPANLKRNQ